MAKAKIRCPECGSDYIVRMIYGMQRYESMRLMEEPVVYGGKALTENSARWECRECGKQFGRPPVWDADGRKLTPEDLCRIGFTSGGYFGGSDSVVIRKDGEEYFLCVSRLPQLDEPVYVREYTKKEWDGLLKMMFEQAYVRDWKQNYTDDTVLDGHQWELELTFTDGHGLEIGGSNAAPALWKTLEQYFQRYVSEAERGRAKPGDILRFFGRYRDEAAGRGWYMEHRKELEAAAAGHRDGLFCPTGH